MDLRNEILTSFPSYYSPVSSVEFECRLFCDDDDDISTTREERTDRHTSDWKRW